jgi:uncharacterized protein YjbI with pentapeptide repeats
LGRTTDRSDVKGADVKGADVKGADVKEADVKEADVKEDRYIVPPPGGYSRC